MKCGFGVTVMVASKRWVYSTLQVQGWIRERDAVRHFAHAAFDAIADFGTEGADSSVELG